MSSIGMKLYNAMMLLMQAVWEPTVAIAQRNAVFEIADCHWAPPKPPERALDINKLFRRKHSRSRRARRRRRQQQQQQQPEQLGGTPSQASPREAPSAFKPIKGKAEAHPTLWDLDHHSDCWPGCIENHGSELRRGYAVTTYKVWRTWDVQRAKDGSIFLATNGAPVPSHIQRSLLMTNQCDWSNFVLQYVVEDVARKIDPSIKVTWKIVIPRPRYRFHITRDTNELPGEIHHSVLLLVTGRGAKYIMDMSGEQFGVPREHRFLPWHAYRKLYVVRNKNWKGKAAWSLDTGDRRRMCGEVDRKQFWSNAQETVQSACAKWNAEDHGTGEWWNEIAEMGPATYTQKASSLRSAVEGALWSQFNP